MRFLDRSRIEKDWWCPRARYWGYQHAGRGIAPVGTRIELEFGTVVHDGIEWAISEEGHPDSQPGPATYKRISEFVLSNGGDEQDAQQWGAIAQGLVLGFMRTVWPGLDQKYELVHLEREVSLQLASDLLFQARPDLLLRHRVTKALWYFELKTTGWIEAQWLQSWNKAPQLQLGALACEAELGEPLAGCVVMGLYKGRGREGRQDSPFAWGWRTEEVPGVLREQFSYEYQRGKRWERFSTVHAPGGVAGWVDGMPDEILAKQFVQTDPIFLRRDMTDALLRQVVAREDEIARAMAEFAREGVVTPDVLDRAFRQHFFNCAPAFGPACEFNEACWIPWVGRDPLSSGTFGPREAHHEAEREHFIRLQEVA